MAHKLFIDIDVADLAIKKKDVIFKVYDDDEKFGELRVSQGAIVWRGRRDKQGRKLGWKRFDMLMQAKARRAERRRPGSKVTVAPARRERY